jgi:nucleotide-binding universal stress UspA family protein
MTPFKHVLVPIDFGDATDSAVGLALSIAQALDARITLMHAFDTSSFAYAAPYIPMIDTQPILAGLRRDMERLREKTLASWAKVDAIVCEGNVYDRIVEVAKKDGCDLIVIGTHGRKGVAHVFLGSVAEKVVRLSPIPVLTVHPAAKHARKATAA